MSRFAILASIAAVAALFALAHASGTRHDLATALESERAAVSVAEERAEAREREHEREIAELRARIAGLESEAGRAASAADEAERGEEKRGGEARTACTEHAGGAPRAVALREKRGTRITHLQVDNDAPVQTFVNGETLQAEWVITAVEGKLIEHRVNVAEEALTTIWINSAEWNDSGSIVPCEPPQGLNQGVEYKEPERARGPLNQGVDYQEPPAPQDQVQEAPVYQNW